MNTATSYNVLAAWRSIVLYQYRHNEDAHRFYLDGMFTVEFVENTLDPDEPVEFNKRINIYTLSLRDGLSTGALERSFVYVPGNLAEARRNKLIVHIQGPVIYSYMKGAIVRPVVFQQEYNPISVFDWKPILLKGIGDLILISDRNRNGWRVFTVRIIMKNKTSKYLFNVDCIDLRDSIGNLNMVPSSPQNVSTIYFQGYMLYTPVQGSNTYDNMILLINHVHNVNSRDDYTTSGPRLQDNLLY